MNFCSNCGTKNEGNSFCTNCGSRLDNVNSNIEVKVSENDGLKTASIVLGIIAVVGSCTIFLSPISILLSIVGLILGIVATKKVKNVLGIVLNSIGLFLSVMILFIMGLFVRLIISLPDDYDDSYYEEVYDWDYDDRYEHGKHHEYY